MAGIVAASALALVTAASVAQRAERPRLTISPAQADAPPDRKPWRSKSEPPATLNPPLPTIESVPPESARADEDPMIAVESFLRRNRKEADDSIHALTREAEALRARLAKVEAALARWQAVAGSLNPGQKWAQPDGPREPGPELSPIETTPATRGGARPVPEPSPTPTSPSEPPGLPAGTIITTPGEPTPTLPTPSTPIPETPPPPK
jgi:hypothetical protein